MNAQQPDGVTPEGMTAHGLTTDGASDATMALVVFESMFGNTARAAQAVARGLREAGVEVDVLDVGDAPTALPPDLDLLVVGAPTHAFGLSRPSTRSDAVRQGAAPTRADTGVREWLEVLAVSPGTSTLVAAFDTHASRVRWLPQAASSTITRLAHRRGLTSAGHHLGLVVNDVKGPLADGERERATEYGAKLAARCRAASVTTVRDLGPVEPVTGDPDVHP